jgi:hypothetical protein
VSHEVRRGSVFTEQLTQAMAKGKGLALSKIIETIEKAEWDILANPELAKASPFRLRSPLISAHRFKAG